MCNQTLGWQTKKLDSRIWNWRLLYWNVRNVPEQCRLTSVDILIQVLYLWIFSFSLFLEFQTLLSFFRLQQLRTLRFSPERRKRTLNLWRKTLLFNTRSSWCHQHQHQVDLFCSKTEKLVLSKRYLARHQKLCFSRGLLRTLFPV